MELDILYKAMVVFLACVIALMAWMVQISASPYHLHHQSPVISSCSFDPHCMCSSSYPHFGEVLCKNAPVNIPLINNSRIFTLTFVNNHLRHLEPRMLQGTGLFRLEIHDNPLHSLHEDSLIGLERSLGGLHITNCKLSSIPSTAIKHLLKLKTLNLTGNGITEINGDELRSVGASLQTLILADNLLTVLPAGIFASLSSLELLDLTSNSISSLDPAVFTPPPPRLAKLNLADNLFQQIPYKQLSSIRTLRFVDLSYNEITTVRAGPAAGKLNLDSLILDYNRITQLNSFGMSHFDVANRTSFRGNPINIMEPNAFKGCRIVELYLTECKLTTIDPEAFSGLENSLEVLDLSGNNITEFAIAIFKHYKHLSSIHLDHNFIPTINWIIDEKNEAAVDDFPLSHFSFQGKTNSALNLKIFPRFKNLHTLELSKPFSTSITADDLSNLTVELETLRINDGGVTSLGNHLFVHTRGIKLLDFTDNHIEKMEAKAFAELSHSLETLILTHALSKSFAKFPNNLFKSLTTLSTLKINHNNLKSLPNDMRDLKELCYLYAQDNTIDDIRPGIFEAEIHKKLKEINLAFNKISKLRTESFTDLSELILINLNDNVISSIESGTFDSLNSLTTLKLRGNKISKIAAESFQNLPSLTFLDLAYNSLKEFNFNVLDQVGTLSNLMVNLSHNSMHNLIGNLSESRDTIHDVHIKLLDLSHNNLTQLTAGWLKPASRSLTHLYLSHNTLLNFTTEIIPELPLLQLLDLSHNSINDLTIDTLKLISNVQVMDLSHNEITDLGKRLFLPLPNLLRLDLSHNKLTNIMDSCFTSTKLTMLDLSHNQLSRAPLGSLSPATASRLLSFDLSGNRISMLPPADSFSRFFSLQSLNLAKNRLSEIGTSLSLMPKLEVLTLAHNPLHIGTDDFVALERTLEHLDVTNTSLSYMPALPLPHLISLEMGENNIQYVPPETATNLSNLKYLDVSSNPVTLTPIFPQLRSLNIADTQITSITKNGTFKDYQLLNELDMKNLPLTEFDRETLAELPILRTLHISNYKTVPNFKIPIWVEGCNSLHNLHLSVTGAPTLGLEIQGDLPGKVRYISVSGGEMKAIPDHLLKGVKYPSVTLVIRNTSVDTFSQSIFNSLPNIRNISLHLFNNTIKFLGNPSNVGQINVPRKIFLVDFTMKNNLWTCDCDLGWTETWQRKMRQYFLHRDYSQDSREALCKNKQNKPVLNILKSDLECGWSSGTHITFNSLLFITVIANTLFVNHLR